jgi:sugar phosphate isomerase/epimerase
MRLGGFFSAGSIEELDGLCAKLDTYGLSAIPAPARLAEMPPEVSYAFGQRASELGMVVGEAGMWQNLLTDDEELQSTRIDMVRRMLDNADRMGCQCVVALVGTKDPSDNPIAPHPFLYTEACQSEFREVVLRILDGLHLETTKFVIEPWTNSFFYQPEQIREFIDFVDHPMFGVHLDQMNMVSQATFYHTTELINRTFDLLADHVASVHLKDVRWDYEHMFLKWDEVHIGEGVMDYQTLLNRISELPADTSCFCEHMAEERDYALNFARLHQLAREAGTRFLMRGEN